MNLKLAKKLRNIARQMAGENQASAYVEANNTKREIIQTADGKFELVDRKYQGTITLHPSCARAIYRRLKRQA